VHFVNPAPAAAAIVMDGREILLVRRRIEPYRDHWGIPAGFQEYEETAAETAVRETLEETGLQIAIAGLFDVLFTRDDPRKRANLVVYMAKPVGGRLRAGDDALAAAFFAIDALPEPIAFENNRLLIQRLLREHPTGDIL
jgi:8-oxo-dGTP diphosphatase